MLTVADVSQMLNTSDDHVNTLIRTGRLKACNIGCGSKRPRWRVTREAVEAFIAGNTGTPAKPAKRARRKQAGDVVAFY